MQPMSRRTTVAGLLAAALTPVSLQAASSADEVIVFSYFAGGKDEAPGLRLAVSKDGLTFRPLHGGEILLTPQVGEKKLMRDPCLVRGQGADAPWHLVWTTAWEGATLGHATSRDLVNWSAQQAIPVMAGVSGTRNVWAPEIIWDRATRSYMLYWSSTVSGRFAETAGTSEDGYNHRLWCVRTTDFERFSEPEVLWDPGFSVIDATFLDHPRLGLHIIVKDETLKPAKKHLRIARARAPGGPFGPLSPPISPDWVEGPTAMMIGDWAYIYYDRYTAGTWGAVRSRDLQTWEDVSSRISFPIGARHGTMVKVPSRLVQNID